MSESLDQEKPQETRRQSFRELPVLSCFEHGGCLFEKQSSTQAKNLTDGMLCVFHNEDEVSERIPDAWKDGKPIFK